MTKKEAEMSAQNRIAKPFTFWIAIGLAIGAGLGVVFHNIPIGAGAGLAIGAALGGVHMLKNNKTT